MRFQQPKMKKFLPIVFVSLSFVFILVIPSLAQNLDNGMMTNAATTAGIGGANLPTILGKIFKIVLSVLGLVALIIIIIAGIQWMTSEGNPEKIKKAKALLSAGLIGLLIIILAYAMVSFIISSFGGITTGETGCTPGLCCSDGLRCDDDGQCTIPDTTCSTSLPQEYFRLVRGEADFDLNGEIYLCSSIRAVFNHIVKESTVTVALNNSTLKVIDSAGDDITGNWQVTGKSILFTPTPNLWTAESDYKLIIPKTISDNNNKYLRGCSMGFIPTGDCSSNGTVDWDFTTNDKKDTTPPYIDHAYPIMHIDNPLYPDRNVSRAPMIEVIFNENINYATIINMNHTDYIVDNPNTWHPLPSAFSLCEIDAQDATCVAGNEYNNDDLLVVPISQGFRIFITNAQWLEPFTWHEIKVDAIKDMCNNPMDESQLWVFETNNSIPNVKDWWPKGSNVCPDALIGVRFATSMYEYEVSVKVKNNDTGNVEFEGSIYPAELNPGPYEATLDTLNGSIKVIDDDDTNISNQFKIFQLELNNTLNIDTPYTVIFDTDLVVNIDGDTLAKEWDFDVTNMEDCACAPVIYEVLPSQGSRQSCVTITGHCFTGTTKRPATIGSLWFDDTQDPPLPEQDGPISAIPQSSADNSITAIVPGVYGDPIADIPDFLGVGVKIIYENNQQEEVEGFSENQFTVIDNALAQGPCIWKLLPHTGKIASQFDIDGIQFGQIPGAINMENWPNDLTYYGAWTPELIEQVMVPGFSTAGNRNVTVTDSSGFVSNPVPFSVIFDRPGVKEFGCNPPPQYSSPSPYKDTEDACTDIVLVVEFNKDMLMNGSSNGVLNSNNYTIKNCGTGEDFDPESCSTDILISGITRYNPASDRIVSISPSSVFAINTWYQVSIASNVESQQGVAMGETSPANDYTWHFKTRDTDVCPIANIDLVPKNKTLTGCPHTEVFQASPMASNCNALTPSSYSYNWSSSDSAVATIGAGNVWNNTVTAIDGGSTWIRVEEDDSSKWTKEKLNVNCCNTDEDCEDPDGDGSNRCEGSVCDDTYGICTPVINEFSPEQGYYNDWVTIQGCWFNNYNSAYSQVRFNEELSSIPFEKCTSSAWQNEQIIAEVPEEGTNPFGYIEVTSAPYGNAFVASSSDIFDDYGSARAGICNLRPSHGIPGSVTQLTANENLLGQGGDDHVYYGDEKAIGYPTPGWVYQQGIRSQLPFNMDVGPLNVKVLQDNIYSNPLNFEVDPVGGGPGDECIDVGCGDQGCDTGFIYCSSPYRCLEETAGACSNCHCCCIVGDPNACNNGLNCFAGQGDCTGAERGLCCGCQNDNQCTNAGCGFLDPKRCCHNRPSAPDVEICTASGGTGAGINTAFTLEFTEQMDKSRLNNEYIKVSKSGLCGNDDGEYINGRCYLKGQIVSTNFIDGNTTIFYPNVCKLTTGTEYKTEFIVGDDGNGIRSSQGVSYGLTGSSSCTWDDDLDCKFFTKITAPQELGGFCAIEKVNVEPRNFTIKGQDEHDYLALALDDDNNAVCVESFDWSSSETSVATVSPVVGLITTASNVNINPIVYGGTDIIATIIITTTESLSCSTGDSYTCGKLKISPTDLPRVIEQQGCEICADGGQSPSPYKDSQQNCPNAQIVVRFNRLINHNTLDSDNVILEVFNFSNQTYVPFIYTSLSAIDSESLTTIYIDGPLYASKKYRVILKSGLEETTGGIKDTNGLPLDGNKNDIQDGSPADDYVWYFETGDTDCDLNKICINPRNAVQLNPPHPNTQNYYTDTYASNCNYLVASSFNGDYEWTLENQQLTQPNTQVAEFLPLALPLIDEWEATVQSLFLGEVDVEAKMSNSTPPHPEINDSVHLIVATNPDIESVFPEDLEDEACRNIVITAKFNQIMDDATISSDTVELWGKYENAQPGLDCTGCGGTEAFENLHNKNIFANLYYKLKNIFAKRVEAQVNNCWCKFPINVSSDITEDNKTVVNIERGLLARNLLHKVIIKGDVQTKYGLELGSDYEWTFTSKERCDLSEVRITPGDIYFNVAGISENLEAHAYDNQGNEIFGVTGYNWDWQWASDNSAVVDISGDLTEPQTEIISKNQDGLSQITATATLNIGVPPETGASVVGQAQAQVSICEHPWLYLDSDTNFQFFYCRDNDPLLPRLLLKGQGVIPSNCGNGIYEPLQGEISCDGFDNTPSHATCLFDCSDWVCDDGYYEREGECITMWPLAPSGLLAEIDETNPDSQINLNWNDNSTNEDGFKIERKSSPDGWDNIDTVSANITFYNDTGLTEATTYYYRVKAFNIGEDGDTYYSAYCSEATETTSCPEGECYEDGQCYTDGSCVANTTQMCSNGEWINSCGDGELNCSEICDGVVGNIPEDNTHCQDDCLNWQCDAGYGNCDGNDNNGCETNLSNTFEHCGTCGNQCDPGYECINGICVYQSIPPSAPSRLSATQNTMYPSTRIDLEWNDNSVNEDGFRIERKAPSLGEDWAEITTVGVDIIFYSDIDLNPATTYYYKILAYNNNGDSAWSNEASAETAIMPSYAPQPPTNLVGLPDITQIELRWNDNSNGTNQEDGFDVQKFDTSANNWIVVTSLDADITSYIHTGLTPSTTYIYRIRAYNANGESYSDSITVTITNPALIPPNAPTGLNGDIDVANPYGQINLSWVDESDNETGFKIERDQTQIAIVATNTEQYQDTGLNPSTSYDYRVRAFNDTGDSDYSNEITVVTGTPGTPSTSPDAPSDLTATANFDEINLTWTDNSGNEDGFEIERYLDSNLDFTDTVGFDITSYLDAGLIPLTSYSYKIRAYNTSGYSSYSNTASATTACLVNQCEYDGSCYNDGVCHPDIDIQQCDGSTASWTTSCGINGINCNEICDGPDPLRHIAICQNDCLGFTCENNWDDCNRNPSDGCEVDLLTTFEHCGKCDSPCNAGEDCFDGICQSEGECFGQPAGTSCGELNMECDGVGNCVCEDGWGDCSIFYPGCETDLTTSSTNCGSCGKRCFQLQRCVNGQCVH